MEEFREHKSGYLVSTEGRIKGKCVEFIKPTITKAGYEMSGIGLVHRIVVETFLGEIPKNYEVNHIDGCKTNNRLNNLEIVTKSENQKHAIRTGLQPVFNGETNPMSELKESEVIDIYNMIKNGETNKDIAIKYNIHDRYVSLIRHGKRWKYLWKSYFTDDSSIRSTGSNSLPLELMVEIIKLISEGTKTNAEIADMYNLDRSTISRVKTKSSWKDVWRYYYRMNNIATTIENTNK